MEFQLCFGSLGHDGVRMHAVVKWSGIEAQSRGMGGGRLSGDADIIRCSTAARALILSQLQVAPQNSGHHYFYQPRRRSSFPRHCRLANCTTTIAPSHADAPQHQRPTGWRPKLTKARTLGTTRPRRSSTGREPPRPLTPRFFRPVAHWFQLLTLYCYCNPARARANGSTRARKPLPRASSA